MKERRTALEVIKAATYLNEIAYYDKKLALYHLNLRVFNEETKKVKHVTKRALGRIIEEKYGKAKLSK